MSFADYRRAYDEMEADENVQRQRGERIILAVKQAEVEQQLKAAEAHYRIRIECAETNIIQNVLARKETLVLHNIQAKYTPGRRSTSWKSVAKAVDAPQGVVDTYTKVGKPSVKVTILE